jgi:hypothetical protein
MAARLQLVEIGAEAVAPLAELLDSPSKRTRWEAAKTLGDIGVLEAAPALLGVIDDESSEVRWLAAGGLIAAGPEVIPLVLRAAVGRAGSRDACAALARVFRGLSRDGEHIVGLLAPVIEALDSLEAADRVPLAAGEALEELRRTGLAAESQRSEVEQELPPAHLYDSRGDWIAFKIGVYVFDIKERWIGWLPWDDDEVVDLEGRYMGSIVHGDRLYRLAEHSAKGYPGFPGYPAFPSLPPLPPPLDFDRNVPPGAADLGLARG